MGILYINGKQYQSKIGLLPAYTNALARVDIGAGWLGQMYGEWDGLIYDVRIYNRALSAEEINEMYLAGRP